MKRLPLILTIVCVALCGLGGVAVMRAKPPEPTVAKDATATVERSDLDVVVTATGTVNANQVVELKSLVSGRLLKLNVDEGDQVKIGQPLAVIDPRETQLQVDQLRAQVQGAESAVAKTSVDLSERERTVKNDIASARSRLAQAQAELKAQPPLTQEAIREAETALKSAQAEKSRLADSAHPTTRSSSKSAVAEAEANLANADAELKREQRLLDKGFVSQKAVEDAELNFRLATARLRSANDADAKLEAGLQMEIAKADEAIRQAQASLRSARLNSYQDKVKLEAYKSAVEDYKKALASQVEVQSLARVRDQNKSTVVQIQAQLRDGERNLGETSLLAPINGFVIKKEIQVGELVTSIGGFSSGTPILRIEDRSKMKVALDINEIDTARLKLGMAATIRVDALPNKPFHGTVTKMAPSSTALVTTASTTSSVATGDAVVKYSVEISIDDPDKALRSGMSATCVLTANHVANALKVPIDFVGHDGPTAYVMVLPGGNLKATPEKKVVTTGLSSGAFIEIVKGVDQGDVLRRPKFSGPARTGMFGGGG
jgi:HlyD family secretion protein